MEAVQEAEHRQGRDPERAVPQMGLLTTEGEQTVLTAVFAANDLVPLVTHQLESHALREGNTGADEDWNAECELCSGQRASRGSGRRYCCYGCVLVYHRRCLVHAALGRDLRDGEEFVCPECVVEEWVGSAEAQDRARRGAVVV